MQPKQNPETHGAFDDTYIGHHESYWLASTQHTNYGPMPGDTTMSAAELAERKDVLKVLDKDVATR